jgi:hypothetical protein
MKITYPLADHLGRALGSRGQRTPVQGQGAEVWALVRAHLHPLQAQRGHHPGVVPLGAGRSTGYPAHEQVWRVIWTTAPTPVRGGPARRRGPPTCTARSIAPDKPICTTTPICIPCARRPRAPTQLAELPGRRRTSAGNPAPDGRGYTRRLAAPIAENPKLRGIASRAC